MKRVSLLKSGVSATLTALILSALFPLQAEAHLPSVGLGPFYDGLFHLLMSPEDSIPVLALALLAGQRGAAYARRQLFMLPAAWLIGGLLGLAFGNGRGASLTCISFLLLGGWVAANAQLSIRIATTLTVMIGLFHGYLNGSGMGRSSDASLALLGLSFAVFVCVAVASSFLVPLRRQWALIAVRVAGSWIVASGLLMLGWTLRGKL
jgi:hydrogenase/urease accessory protein HupE